MTEPQTGILNRPPGHLLLVALTFESQTPTDAQQGLEALRALVRRELTSDLDDLDRAALDVPPAETGELGFADHYYRYFLTITLGLSSSGYDVLGLPQEEKPADLVTIPWSSLGDAPSASQASGDLILQICSDNVYINEHVLRRVEEEVGDRFRVEWTVSGAQRYTSTGGRSRKEDGRALIGFLDGTSNLDPRHHEEDQALVFIDPAHVSDYPQNPPAEPPADQYHANPKFPTDLRPVPTSEPDWTKGGTYMVVRTSLLRTPQWDKSTLGQQQGSVGRFKFSGAFLDLADDPARLQDPPAFEQDQNNQAVPFASHVRKANPRRSPEDAKRRIFRRGYPLIQATAQGLQRGLVFVCFARTTSTQFEFILRGWIKNPDFPEPGTGPDTLLAGFEEVLLGGYYFVPPLAHKTQPWSWLLPEPSSASESPAQLG